MEDLMGMNSLKSPWHGPFRAGRGPRKGYIAHSKGPSIPRGLHTGGYDPPDGG